MSYHKAVKKIAGLKPWDSNHQACTTVQINIFQHLWIKRMVNHFFSLVNSENTIIKGLKYYFYMQSNFKNFLSCVFSKWYQVENFTDNDKSALLSRIDYVERTEPRSHYNIASDAE